MTTQEINAELEIVRLKGDVKFKAPLGYYAPAGYCFKHKKLGYFAFNTDDKNYPYMPCGGLKALQTILDDGGLLNFDNAKWLHEIVRA